MNTAILLTCFNRKAKTVACLNSLISITCNCDIYLVDDGSTDGTDLEVSILFPTVQIIHGNGQLYWNRGMNKAWELASKVKNYDFYILLNDDIVLYTNWFNELFECSRLMKDNAIISGIIESEDKTRVLYGGSDLNKRQIKPNGKLQKIKRLNGNVVLIPNAVYQKLGNLDNKYHHDLGDVDYGLRAEKSGIGVFSTRLGVASGTTNTICRVRQNKTTLLKRFYTLYSPLGSNPRINFYFRKRHFGLSNAILFYIFQHFLIAIPDSVNNALFGDKYQ